MQKRIEIKTFTVLREFETSQVEVFIANLYLNGTLQITLESEDLDILNSFIGEEVGKILRRAFEYSEEVLVIYKK